MDIDAKRTLIAKIEGLPPEQRKRVEGYVDALLEGRRTDSGRGDGQNWSGEEGSNTICCKSMCIVQAVDHGG